jgi:hypothetical protein
MKMRAGLRARLGRLEERLAERCFPHVIYRLYSHEDAGESTGYTAGNVTFLRGPDETLEQCAERAFAATGTVCLVATYSHAPRWTPPEREEAVSGALAAADATEPHGPQNPLDAYFEMAGIGREASAEE